MFSAVSRRALGMLLAGAAVSTATPAQTAGLPPSGDKPVLTVSGRISVTNGDGTARFDRAMLEALGMVGFETTTPWYQGTVKFEGVPLERLMQAVGATGSRIVAVALNDYSAELPIEDVHRYNVILALKRNGEYMPVRDKGPLFIVYPFDNNPELKSQKYYSRSVWQVKRIEVR